MFLRSGRSDYFKTIRLRKSLDLIENELRFCKPSHQNKTLQSQKYCRLLMLGY